MDSLFFNLDIDYFYYLIYSVGFLIMAAVLAAALRKSQDALFIDAFYMLITFSFCRGIATLVEFNLSPYASYGFSDISESLYGMFSVIANIFLFQSAIGFLMYKSEAKTKFRVVPLIIFSGYLIFYMINVVPARELDGMARQSFGFHSAILMAIAMFNLYHILSRKTLGLLFFGAGFIVYALFEGLIPEGAVFRIDVRFAKILAIALLASASFFIRLLLAEKKAVTKVGYI